MKLHKNFTEVLFCCFVRTQLTQSYYLRDVTCTREGKELESIGTWYNQLDSRELNIAESLQFLDDFFLCICYLLEARVKRQKEWDEQQRRIQLVRALATPVRPP